MRRSKPPPASVVAMFASGLAAVALCGCAHRPIVSLEDPRVRRAPGIVKAMEITFERQADRRLCGLACLASVLRYWDAPASQLALLEAHPPEAPQRGYALGELCSIAQAMGLAGYCAHGDLNFLEAQVKRGRPVIVAIEVDPPRRLRWLAPWASGSQKGNSYTHAVVVCGMQDGRLWILNPSVGFEPIEKGRLDALWKAREHACLLIGRIDQPEPAPPGGGPEPQPLDASSR